MRHTSRAAASLALALALAGCSRDLDLPPERGAPALTGLSPASAFSGELVEVLGGPFEADPAANLVVFPRGSARAAARTAAGLLVRVPSDAGSGPITVTTPAGTSAPSPAFTWLGLGQPRGASVTAAVPLLTRPAGLHVVRGQLFAELGLLQAVARLGATVAQPPFSALTSAAAGPGRAASSGSALYVVVPAAAGPELRQVDVASGAVVAGGVPVTTADGQPCAIEEIELALASGASGAFTGDLLVAVCTGRAAFAGSRYALWPAVPQPTGWAPLQPSTELRLDGAQAFLWARLRDGGAGRIATMVWGSGPVRAGLIDFGASPPAVQWLDRPTPYGFFGPFATRPTGAPGTVAGATQDKRIALVSTTVPSLLLGSVDPLFSGNADLLALTDGDTLVAASAADGLVVGISLVGGLLGARVQWGHRVEAPTALLADGPRIWVASAGSNEVVALDEVTGSVVARRVAEVRPSALAYWPERPGFGGAGVVSAGLQEPGGWVDWAVGSAAPAGALLEVPGGSRVYPTALAANPALGAVFAGGAHSVLPAFVLTTTARDRVEALEADLEVLAPAGEATLALHGRGATLLDAAGRHEVVTFTDFQRWARPAVARDGRVALGWNNQRPRVELTTLDGLLAGAPPLVAADPGPEVSSLAFLDGEPWVFTGPSGVAVSAASRLGPAGALLDTVQATLAWPFVQSPNGRVLAAPNPAGRGVLLHAADPVAGFPVQAAIDVPGTVTDLAFDERGERLFVLTRSPAAITVVE